MLKSTKTITCLTAICAVFALVGTSWGSQVNIRIKRDKIDADLNRAPLRAVLADISAKSGIQVYIEKGLGGNVTAMFSNLSLEEGLKRVLADYSNSMIFSKAKTGPERGKIMLTEIKVFEKGHSDNADFEILAASTAEKSAGQESGSAALTAQTQSGEALSASGGTQASGSFAPPGQPGSRLLASISKRDHIQISRLRRQVMEMRQDLKTMTDDKAKAKTRATIAQKTAELKKRENWMQARTRGLSRLERQMAGH